MGTSFWLIVFLVFLIVEIFTMGLTTIWFAGGALVAFFLELAHVSWVFQVIAFLAVSTVLLILTRPIAMKFFNGERQKTNAESLIGQKAIVIETIDPLRNVGRVEINGMEWSAKTNSEQQIEVGKVVHIEAIQGVKLIVKKEEE